MRSFFCFHHTVCVVENKIVLWNGRVLLFLLILLFSLNIKVKGQSQDTISFLNYNLLNYPSAGTGYAGDTTNRHPHYRTIMNAVDPDILVVQEITSQTGINGFLSNVLNATTNTYSAAPFINGYDTDNGLFYKTDKFHAVTNDVIYTELRDINQFKLVHTLSGDTIRIFSVHLKASSGSANEAQRGREVDSIRKVTNTLPAGTDFIVCGDFNIYMSTEIAYQKLLQVTGGNEGHFIDPITMTGTWNQVAYSSHHTQSPRIRAFGGGSTGGMDDRFDLILYSQSISLSGGMKYVPNSQIPYGNDGNLYNDSINNPSNTAVSPDVANAIHYAADHIPVKALFTMEYNPGSVPTDFGALALLNPISPMCANANQAMAVRIKNFGAFTVDFASDNLEVTLKVTTPSSGIQTYNQTISSGTIAPGDSLTVNFGSLINMSATGTYLFVSYTTQTNDANQLNDTMSTTNVTVTASATASVSPAGPISICNGDSIVLTASTGISYLWSNGATTQNITVQDTGNYSAQVTISGGCSSSSNQVNVSFIVPPSNGIVFYESMGTVGGTTSIASHEGNSGFDNDGYTMTGSSDLRATNASFGYAGASAVANVFFTDAGKYFTISGINTLGFTNLQLSHGIHKATIASDGTEISVAISTNGVDYDTLSVTPLNTGSGTATWYLRTVSGVIPSVPSLSIRFMHTSGTADFRIDDITLSGAGSSSTITAGGSTALCQGDSVVLTASTGSSYHWNTGATTQSISVNTAGSYFATVSCLNTDTVNVTVSNCQDVTLNLKAFIQGFYIGNQAMKAVADPLGNPGICDTITVELAEAVSPNNITYSFSSVLATDGTGSFVFPPSVINNSYYIIVKHRNSLETWSSAPVLFSNFTIIYDFTTSAGTAYGNNLLNIDGEFCIYSGDVTDGVTNGIQDGIIDREDFDSIESALSSFVSGYTIFDLTGDGIVESADFSLIENNIDFGIFVMRP